MSTLLCDLRHMIVRGRRLVEEIRVLEGSSDKSCTIYLSVNGEVAEWLKALPC